MTHDQMIEVIQAYKAGKKLEVKNLFTATQPEWVEWIGPFNFNFGFYAYRVKKEPRTRWMVDVVDKTNGRPYYTKGFMSKEKADQYLARHREGRYWTVTEPYEVVERT